MGEQSKIFCGAFLFFVIGFPAFFAQDSIFKLVGKWKARWTLSVPPGEDISRYSADGMMHFYEDGTGEIIVYGRKDSVLATETAINSVLWTMENDTLHIVSKGEKTGIKYTITEKKEDFLRLVLVDDILLVLTRQE